MMTNTNEIDLSAWATSFESTAEWRREKAEERPEDAKRNLSAAEKLDSLAAQFAAGDVDPELVAQYAALGEDDDLSYRVSEVESEMTREIGFSAFYDKPEDYIHELLRRVKHD